MRFISTPRSSSYFHTLLRISLGLLVLLFARTIFSQDCSALSFDGNGDYVDAPSPITGNTDFTIEGWFIDNNNQVFTHVIAWGIPAGPPNVESVFALTDVQGEFKIIDHAFDEQNFIEPFPNVNIRDGNWHYWAATKSGNNVTLYLDNETHTYITGTVQPFDLHSITDIGHNPSDFGNTWRGVMDEIRIWDYARTADQLNEYKFCEPDPSESGLVAYYNFNQGVPNGNNTGLNTLIDHTGGNDGTLYNFALSGDISNWADGNADVCTSCPAPPAPPVAGKTFSTTLSPASTHPNQNIFATDGIQLANGEYRTTGIFISPNDEAYLYYGAFDAAGNAIGTPKEMEFSSSAGQTFIYNEDFFAMPNILPITDAGGNPDGFVAGATVEINGTTRDPLFVRLDNDGCMVSSEILFNDGMSSQESESLRDMLQMPNGDILMLIERNFDSEMLLTQIKPSGAQVKTNRYFISDYIVNPIAITAVSGLSNPDAAFAVTGLSGPTGQAIYLMMLDNNLNVVDQVLIYDMDMSGDTRDVPTDLVQNEDKLAICGFMEVPFTGGNPLFLLNVIPFDASGNLDGTPFSSAYYDIDNVDGLQGEAHIPFSIIYSDQKDFVLAGITIEPGDGNFTPFAISLDDFGFDNWARYYTHGNIDRGFNFDVELTADGDYFFTGVKWSNPNVSTTPLWAAKAKTDGTFEGSECEEQVVPEINSILPDPFSIGADISQLDFFSSTPDERCTEVPLTAEYCNQYCPPEEEGTFLCGQSIISCFSGFTTGPGESDPQDPNKIADDFVLAMIDFRDHSGAPMNASQAWTGPGSPHPLYHHPSWTSSNVGQVFGLAIDDDYNAYTTTTTIHGQMPPGNLPGAGPGTIYKIDNVTGQIAVWANLPNSLTGNGNVESGLGNICYDPDHQRLFVSNFLDGKIYSLDLSGNILEAYDPPLNDPAVNGQGFHDPVVTSGYEPLGQRIWGVGYHKGTLYFSVWGQHRGLPSNLRKENEIWSVNLTGTGDFPGGINLNGDKFDAAVLKKCLTCPGPFLSQYTLFSRGPVSDIAFTCQDEILFASKTMYYRSAGQNGDHNHWNPGYRFAHYGIIRKLPISNFSAAPVAYYVGNHGGNNNCSGGIDVGYGSFDPNTQSLPDVCDQKLWSTGDALIYDNVDPKEFVYGVAGIDLTGNSPSSASQTSIYIDVNDDPATAGKTFYGDIEIFKCGCCTDPIIDCDSLVVAVDSISMPDDSTCCYSVDLTNNIGSDITQVCVDLTNSPDWIINVSTINAPGFSWGTTTSNQICIENPNGIPAGTTNDVFEFCLTELDLAAIDTQCLVFSWYEGENRTDCLDTVKTYCSPPTIKDTCFIIDSIVAECQPDNDYAYCVSFNVTNISAFPATGFTLFNLPPGFSFGGDCGCGGAIFAGTDYNFDWLSPTLAPGDTRAVCVEIVSSNPILDPTQIYFNGAIQSATTCCKSPDDICVPLEPCCSPCENITAAIDNNSSNPDSCCFALDFNYDCDYFYFTKIDFKIITPGVIFGSHSICDPDWGICGTPDPDSVCIEPNTGIMAPGFYDDLFKFCLSNINDATQIPQEVKITFWTLDQFDRDSVACDTILQFDCDTISGPCTFITNEQIECIPDSGKYRITLDVQNISNPSFSADGVLIQPTADISPNPIYFPSPLPNDGSVETISFCYTPATFPDPDNELVLIYKLFEGDYHNCCNGNETVYDTLALPPCDPCCKDFDDFCERVNDGFSWSVDPDSCKLTIEPKNFTDCMEIVDWVWGDGSPNGGQSNPDGSFCHYYDQPGNYFVCFLAVERDENGNICWEKEFCEQISVDCPTGNPCDSLDFAWSYDNSQQFGECCWNVDLEQQYGDNVVKAVLIDNVQGAGISIHPNGGWTTGSVFSQYDLVPPGGGFIQQGTYNDQFTVCFENITNIPQQLDLYWLITDPTNPDSCIWVCPETIFSDCPIDEDPCCKDFDDFCERVNDGFSWSVDPDSCKLTIEPKNFTDCMEIVDWVWGDGSPNGGQPNPNGSFCHYYDQGDTYKICFLAVERDESGNICWQKEYCEKITIDCSGDCACNGWENLAFGFPGPNGYETPVSCNNMDPVEIPCPSTVNNFYFHGNFICTDTCGIGIDWELIPAGGGTPIAAGNINTFNPNTGNSYLFTINFMPYPASGQYQLVLKANCGGEICECSVLFEIPDCPKDCTCDNPIFPNRKAIINAIHLTDCRTALLPLFDLDAICDEVSWRYLDGSLNGVQIGTSFGSDPVYYDFPSSGKYTICMKVVRTLDDGTTCEEERCQKVKIRCGLPTLACDANNPLIANPGFSDGATPGILGNGGTSAGWEASFGAPEVEEEGIVDEFSMRLAGNKVESDGISQSIQLNGSDIYSLSLTGTTEIGFGHPTTSVVVRISDQPQVGLTCEGDCEEVYVSKWCWVDTIPPITIQTYIELENPTLNQGDRFLTIHVKNESENPALKSVINIDAVCMEADSCCSDTTNFAENVKNAVNFVYDLDSCLATVTVDSLGDCTEISEIDWGDGTTSTNVGANNTISHAYANCDSTYQIILTAIGTTEVGGTCFMDEFPIGIASSSFEQHYGNDVKLYPNPTTGRLILEFSDPLNSNLEVQIVDIVGRTINVQHLLKGISRHQTDVTNLTPAVYFIRLIDEDGRMWHSKFVKQ